jgi:hypothetical protein
MYLINVAKYKNIKTIIFLILCNSISSVSAQYNYSSFTDSENNYRSEIPFVRNINPDQVLPSTILTVLPHDGSHSRHSAPQTLYRFARCYFLILASEMNASGFPSGEHISSIGYNYQYGTDVSTTGYFKVYLENTSDITNNKSMNWNQAITTMTLVNSDSLKIQTASGIFDIPLNNSSAFTYTGGGIYVAFEYSNPTGPLSTFSNVCWTNRILPAPILKSSQSDDSIRLIATGTSNLRPEMRFGCDKTDIVSTGIIYALGMTGTNPCLDSSLIYFSVNHLRNISDAITVQSKVKNIYTGIIRQVFTDILISDSVESINLSHKISPSDVISADSILVSASASGEETTVNNLSNYIQHTSVNSWSHYIPSSPPTGAVGLNVGTGDCVAKFFTGCSLTICSVELSFFAESGWGNTPYKVIIYAADGPAGKPGTLLHISTLRISPPGTTGVVKKPVYILNEPVIIPAGYYYVGYAQTTERNLRITYQIEYPIRENTFYSTTSTGSGVWYPFAEIAPFRVDVAPRTYLTLKLKTYLQGFYNGDTMNPDTVKIILRNLNAPFNSIDSAKSVLDSNGLGLFNFINANSDSCYFFEVKHRNHIRTFSSSMCRKLNGSPSNYDFTSSDTSAYGNNLIFIPGNISAGGFAIYGGDINQDGSVDLIDVSEVYNDIINFSTGYVISDMTGNNSTDLNDLVLTYNNAAGFITEITP